MKDGFMEMFASHIHVIARRLERAGYGKLDRVNSDDTMKTFLFVYNGNTYNIVIAKES